MYFPSGRTICASDISSPPEIFDRLRPYYTNQRYRFEIPAAEFGESHDFLGDYGYAFEVVDEVEPFAVVGAMYTEHPETIFRESVLPRSAGDYHVFVMTDRAAVEQVVSEGPGGSLVSIAKLPSNLHRTSAVATRRIA